MNKDDKDVNAFVIGSLVLVTVVIGMILYAIFQYA